MKLSGQRIPRLRLAGAVTILLTCAHATARAADEKVIEQGKAATAIVTRDGRFIVGTACAVDESGYFLTTSHAISRGGQLKLTIRPGERDEQSVAFEEARRDDGTGLVLLKATTKQPVSALSLGDNNKLRETSPVIALGFAAATLSQGDGVAYPGPTVLEGVVTSLLKSKGQLRHLEIRLAPPMGLPGAVVLDQQGRLVGLLSSRGGADRAGAMQLISVQSIRNLLDQPNLSAKIPQVAYSDRDKPVELLVQIANFAGRPAEGRWDVTLGVGGPPQVRVVHAERKAAGSYLARFVPVPLLEGKEMVEVTARFDGGMIVGSMEPLDVSVGDKKLALRELLGIARQKNEFIATPRWGTVCRGTTFKPAELTVRLADRPFTFDARRLHSLSIHAPEPSEMEIPLQIRVMVGEKVLAELKSVLRIAPPRPDGQGAALPVAPRGAVSGGNRVVRVKALAAPGGVEQLVLAGRAGLLFARNSASRVSVLEVDGGRVVSTLDAKERLIDMSLSPDERYVLVSDFGGHNTGYGTPIRQHWVHRFDVATRRWETARAVKIAGRIEAVRGDLVLLQELDQHVSVSLNRWPREGDSLVEVARSGCGYSGDIEYDWRSRRMIHGSAGSSSAEIAAFRVDPDAIKPMESSGTYGTAQGGGGSCVLGIDGKNFYYGGLQVDAQDVKHNRNKFAEPILAAAVDVAFGEKAFYDVHTGKRLGEIGFPTRAFALSSDGSYLYAYDGAHESIVVFRISS